jgi:uncharacterized membrane protein
MLQYAAIPVCVVLYAALCHYTNSVEGTEVLGAALSIGPVCLLGAAFAWRWAHPLVALAVLGAAALLVYAAWPALEQNFSRLYVSEECALYGLLCVSFARSLFGERTAVCTLLADRVHGPLSAAELRYTRHVTAAWAVFFALISVTTLSLYIWATLRIWSMFSNFCTLPLVLLMFIAEFTVRRCVLPRVGAGLIATLRVYFAGSH